MNLSNLIQYFEERCNAVCDGAFPQDGDLVVMELRTVKETFEYACLVTVDRETLFTLDYEFLWSWHRNPPKKFHIEPEPLVLHMRNIDEVPLTMPQPVSAPVHKTVRRRATEYV